MNAKTTDLRQLIHQLRIEMDWVSRTGLEVEFSKSVTDQESDLPSLAEEPLVSVEVGQPVLADDVQEATVESKEDDVPPPAFEPDPLDEPSQKIEHFPPERARVRDAQAGRPWERYITETSAEDHQSHEREIMPRQRSEEPPHVQNSSLSQPSNETGYEVLPRARSLQEVRDILGNCERCKLHRMGRKNIVFGVGNPKAELMFVGEGPGRQEDQAGEPFVGDAGQLLTRIIEGGMKLRRSDVYIANIVKCRPPQNRDPMPDEVESCEPFLRAQIHQIRPKVIVALGKYAAQTLLRSKVPISRLRGRWATYEGIDLMPTFHPAYLLRNPNEKRPVWEDVQAVMRRLSR